MNPQLENGYTSLANEIIEEIIKLPLSNYEFRILLAIFRKTYGWNKKEDLISLSQLSEITKIQRSHCQRSLKKLSQKNIISVTQTGNGLTQNVSFQKDYTKWKVLPKQVTVTNPIKKCYQSDQKVLPKQVTTKENTKENTKEIPLLNIFDEFRKNYPGTKRGLKTEFTNFTKKHTDYKNIIEAGELMFALNNQLRWREACKEIGKFVPEWKNLTTWINQRCWEEIHEKKELEA